MSYRYEKIESGVYDLVIAGWEEGIAESPILGIGNMVNVDIFQNKGLVQAQHAAKLDSTNKFTSLPLWIVKDPTAGGDYYALDADGNVHTETTGWSILGGNTTPGNGAGMAVYISQNDPTKSFLFVARAAAIDVYDIDTATWTNSWKTIESDARHPMFLGSDQRLYIGNEWKVASFEEVAGVTFDPANAATYTWNPSALDLPSYYNITCLEQLGDNLAIGTQIGSNGNESSAELFFWDRESSSFFRPVSFATDGIKQLLTVNNSIVVYAGTGADIFTTNGSSATLVTRFDNIDFSNSGLVTAPRAGAIEGIANSEILIGVSNVSNAGLSPMGVYSVREGKFVLRNKISTGGDGSQDTLRIGCILAFDRDRFYIGWQDSNTSTYGIDIVNGDGDRYEDWSPTIETDLIPVNTNYFPTNLNEVEIRIADDLENNEGVRISWRDSLDDAYSTPVTFNDTNMLGKTTYALPIGIENVENLQLKIEILANGDSSPRLWEVRLR